MREVVGICFDSDVEQGSRELVCDCLKELNLTAHEFMDVSSFSPSTLSLFFTTQLARGKDDDFSKNYIVCPLGGRHGVQLPQQKKLLTQMIQTWWKSFRKLNHWRYLATIDEVTGLFNQRKLKEDLFREMQVHDQNNDSFSMLFIDIDNFKGINDKHGHVIGSKLLSSVANIFHSFRKTTPYMYRYGGDEFVILLPATNIQEAYEFAENLCHAIKNTDFVVSAKKSCHLSVSIGICGYPQDASNLEDIIAVADSMMYTSKKTGKGKVVYKKV